MLYAVHTPIFAVTYCSQAPLTGDYTISGTCTLNTTFEGAQTGNVIIASGAQVTLLADQVLVYNSGRQITITNTAVINLNTTAGHNAKLVQGTICIVDADGDTYPKSIDGNNQSYTTTTCPAGTIARAAGQQADCNDASATYFATLTCYPDADSDTYYSTVSQSVCGTATTCAALSPAQSATVGTDCCDTDANAKPGQTAYFTTPRTTCGGYDYDCGGTEVLDSTGIQASTYACTNPCGGCALNYGATAGWLTAPPATCGGTGTLYSMVGGYTSGTCYNVASCATLVTGNASAKRGCH